MLTLDNVTIIGVAGTKALETLRAIDYSKRRIQFAASKLITPDDLSSQDTNTEIIKCEPLNYEQYNHFVVYRLHEYVDTDYCLLVQNDGYVVYPEKWRSEFLDYDYIGAPWHLPNDSYSFRDESGTIYRVGNGGFSLRSKRLLRVPTDLSLEWKQYYGNYHEDGFICVHNRRTFELAGCKFAPLEIAKYFSHESKIPETEGILPFGFHGKDSYHYITTNKKVML